MQIVGRRHADVDVFAASAAFERLRTWVDTYRIRPGVGCDPGRAGRIARPLAGTRGLGQERTTCRCPSPMTDPGPDERTIDRIAALPIWQGRPTFEPLVGGLSNISFRAADSGGRYVVRAGHDYPFHHVFAIAS